MRWDNLRLVDDEALIERSAVIRTIDTPEFRGVTFYEIHARSVINKVPAASHVPFTWTINPYRGCTHKCTYCFARKTHEYLDFDAGADFDSKIVVKVNAAEVVRRELGAPKWAGEHIAMGTNVDCYQRAEGRYRLMPGILAALRDTRNPFSILTKGSLILRDLPLLQEAAERAEVGTAVSVGFLDMDLWRIYEPGTPSPRKRLEVCATLNEHDIACGVLMGPILPYLTDSPRQIDAAVRQIAQAGATSVSAITLHLRPGARDWFLRALREHHPELVGPYQRLYGRGAYAPKEFQERISRRVREAAHKYGMDRRPVRAAPAADAAKPTQLTLL